MQMQLLYICHKNKKALLFLERYFFIVSLMIEMITILHYKLIQLTNKYF